MKPLALIFSASYNPKRKPHAFVSSIVFPSIILDVPSRRNSI